jgi:hypothetical protein
MLLSRRAIKRDRDREGVFSVDFGNCLIDVALKIMGLLLGKDRRALTFS